MNEQIVSYRTAKLAEQEMFTLDTIAYYRIIKPTIERKYDRYKLYYRNDSIKYNNNFYDPEYLNAPTINQLIKWLFDKHNIFIQTVINDGPSFEISINYITNDGFISTLITVNSNRKDYNRILEKCTYEALIKVRNYSNVIQTYQRKIFIK